MSTPKERLELEQLEVPRTDPAAMFKHFGPGIILMMTGVGTSHAITAPVAGGRFEYALLWAVLFAYVFKFYGFQYAFYFTNATGHSIMDAMCTQPGKWPVWYVLVITLIQMVFGQAGRAVAAAAVLYFAFTEFGPMSISLEVWAIIIGTISAGMVLMGAYKTIASMAKILVIILAVSAIFVFLYSPPPISAFSWYLKFGLPAGSWMVFAAGIGLLPTGIDVALQSSEWGKAKKDGMPYIRNTLEEQGYCGQFDSFNPRYEDLVVDVNKLPDHTQTYLKKWWKIATLDYAVGHVVSFVLASIFLMLAAHWLYPSAVEGRAVIGELSGMFTQAVGDWMMYVFLLGMFASTWSTTLNYFDGWPRLVAACMRNLSRTTAQYTGIDDPTDEAKKKVLSEVWIWRICLAVSFVGSLAVIIGIPKPVFLVLLASVLAMVIAPILFFYHIYFVLKVVPKDSPFYPNAFQKYFAWISLIVFTILILIAFYAQYVGG